MKRKIGEILMLYCVKRSHKLHKLSKYMGDTTTLIMPTYLLEKRKIKWLNRIVSLNIYLDKLK